MGQPPKRPSESTRHLRAVGVGLRDLTPEETDLRTRQILMWGHAADCMNALVDESEKQREEGAQMRASAAEAVDSVRRTVLVAATVSVILHLAISMLASGGALAPVQAKADPSAQEP